MGIKKICANCKFFSPVDGAYDVSGNKIIRLGICNAPKPMCSMDFIRTEVKGNTKAKRCELFKRKRPIIRFLP